MADEIEARLLRFAIAPLIALRSWRSSSAVRSARSNEWSAPSRSCGEPIHRFRSSCSKPLEPLAARACRGCRSSRKDPAMVPPDHAHRTKLRVEGMDCASCAAKIEAALRRVPGVSEVGVSVPAGTVTVTHHGKAEASRAPNLFPGLRGRWSGVCNPAWVTVRAALPATATAIAEEAGASRASSRPGKRRAVVAKPTGAADDRLWGCASPGLRRRQARPSDGALALLRGPRHRPRADRLSRPCCGAPRHSLLHRDVDDDRRARRRDHRRD